MSPKYLLLFLFPVLAGCQQDYVDSPLTEQEWIVQSVEERNNFSWSDAHQYYPIETIRFYKDYTLEVTYIDDPNIYFGDWTDYYQDVNCSDPPCQDLHLLVINLYHPSPLPTVFEVTRLRSNRLKLFSDETSPNVRFDFTP